MYLLYLQIIVRIKYIFLYCYNVFVLSNILFQMIITRQLKKEQLLSKSIISISAIFIIVLNMSRILLFTVN